MIKILNGELKVKDNEMLIAKATGIYAIQEFLRYRELGTVEEIKECINFKKYFDNLYGEGLEVANYHLNGDLEPFDNFYDEALDN